MKKGRKDFIKKAHENACSEWKTKIEKEFPELFKEDALVVGKWYKFGGDYLICIEEINDKKGVVYGFMNNSWYKSNDFQLIGGFYQYILATDKEVEQALIKEAKKRGFKEGVSFKLIEGSVGMLNSTKITKDYEIVYEASINRLVLKRIGILYTIFKDGVWATIIKETITKEQAEKELGKTILN